MRWVVLICLTGCWTATPPAKPAAKPVALAKLPPCPMKLDEQGHLLIGGNDVGELIPEDDLQQHEVTTKELKERLRVYQTGTDAWVSYRDHENYHGPGGAAVLWHVTCSGEKLDELEIDGANFGYAALHPDRKHLYYSGVGVSVLDLATKQHRAVTNGTVVKSCWDSGTVEPGFTLHDIVDSVTNEYVEFTRGGPCGFEGDYDGTLMRKRLPNGVEERATPITSVVKTNGEIWLAEGACPSKVFRSTDWKTWTAVAVPDLFGPGTIVPDRRSPKTLIVTAGQCGYAPGGTASITRDAGATWKEIESVNGRVQWTRGDSIDTMEIGAGDQLMRWNGSDFVDAGEAPQGDWPSPPKTVVIDGRKLELTSFGLIDSTTGERLYPRRVTP